jgi:peptidyl-prolyl cis-trans isomerase SurA
VPYEKPGPLSRATYLPTLALMLAVWGVQPSDLAAQSASKPDELSGVLAEQLAITEDEIEQRARLLALSANIGSQAKENFQRLVKSKSTEDRLRALQQEVIDANPGKTREELIAIFQERQKGFGAALQKQAVEEAREALMPKLRRAAREELVSERLRRDRGSPQP